MPVTGLWFITVMHILALLLACPVTAFKYEQLHSYNSPWHSCAAMVQAIKVPMVVMFVEVVMILSARF